jgi:hypothetical protein
MVKMINKAYGNEMWVADDRVEEYKTAGHKLAVVPSDENTTESKPKAKKKTAKK